MEQFELLHCGILADLAHFCSARPVRCSWRSITKCKRNKIPRCELLTDAVSLLAASIDTYVSPTMATQIAIFLSSAYPNVQDQFYNIRVKLNALEIDKI